MVTRTSCSDVDKSGLIRGYFNTLLVHFYIFFLPLFLDINLLVVALTEVDVEPLIYMLVKFDLFHLNQNIFDRKENHYL